MKLNSVPACFSLALLAGGLSTRLRPLTEKIPKALVPILGEPFIAHQLRLLQKKGLRQVVILTGYLGEQIVDYVGNGTRFGLDVTYAADGFPLLGTAGAIKKALPLLGDDFFVMYGDSYLVCDYRKVQAHYEAAEKLALMTVFKNDGQWDASNVIFKAGKIFSYDKESLHVDRQHIDYGLGIFNQKAFSMVTENQPADLALLYQHLLCCDQLSAYEVFERFYEIGSFRGITEIEGILNEKQYS
jgi:NDP-sugar pyrophosphorylase family protein